MYTFISLLSLNGHGSVSIREVQDLIKNYLEPVVDRKPLNNTIYTIKDVCFALNDVSTKLEDLLAITDSLESASKNEILAKPKKWTKINGKMY